MTTQPIIRSIACLRAKELQDQTPDALVTQELLEDRAIISVSMHNRVLETDFIESQRSISLPRRSIEYYDVLGQGIKLGIIVPKKRAQEEINKMKRVKGEDRFVIFSYEGDSTDYFVV
jgi:hypothetical protein